MPRCLEDAVVAGFTAPVELQAVFSACALPLTVFAKMMQPSADMTPTRRLFGEFAIDRINGIIDRCVIESCSM